MDTINAARRSENMRRIRSRDTKPEILVRSLVHRMGFRFRLHRKDLPGRPDLVFVSARKVIFVHGCFWHQHCRCTDGRMPKSRTSYWTPKLLRNKERDKASRDRLRRMGWRSLIVWDCETANSEILEMKIRNFLS
jgi:DNA mismatch endonuclease, patch repair protein